MAREHARILCSIWRPDSTFRHRSPDAQRLYFLLLSQRELNNAGAMPVMVGKWARCSTGTTTADIEKALAELVEHRYVVVDWDTEELLIRSFMRNDGILKHPYTRRSALRSAEQIESALLRSEAARELIRIGHPEGIDAAFRLDPDATLTTQPDAISTGTQTTQPDDIQTTRRDAIDPAKGVGEGVGEGEGVTSGGGSVGGESTTPPAPNLDLDNPRCGKHRDIPATEAGPNCRACGAVRKQLASTASPDAAAAERAARRDLIDRCPDCDPNGMREFGELGLGRCVHPTLTEGATS